jgi:hypothetical protein
MSVHTPARPQAAEAPETPPPGVVNQVRPSARCYACGDGVVVAVCSRCGRLLCRTHDSAAGPLSPRALLRLFHDEPDSAAEPDSKPTDSAEKPTDKAAGSGVTRKGGEKRKNADKKDADRKVAKQKDADRKDIEADGTTAEEKKAGQRKSADRSEDRDDSRPPDPAKWSRTEGKRVGSQWPPTDVPAADPRRRERPRGARQRRYCADCVPHVRPYDAELIAATTTGALGTFVLPIHSVLGGLLLGVGVLRFAVRIALGMRPRPPRTSARRADPALNPNLNKIKAREYIRGTIRLGEDRKYNATVHEVVGSVRVEGHWSRAHRSELDRRRRRTRTDPTTVRAGHLVLHGPARVEFQTASDGEANGGPALILRPRVADHEILRTADRYGDTRWRPTFRYDISPPDSGWELPVWLTPNIAADLDRHVLELDLQWCTRKPERPRAGVPLQIIKVLELRVPAHWGTVEYLSPLGDDRLIGQPEPDEDSGVGRRTLTWKKIRFPKETDRGSQRLMVRFSDAIDLDYELTGRIEARFRGAVSGLTRIGLYRTDGGPVKGLDGARSPITVADFTFGLSLKGLRYQQQRTVPDRSRAEDVDRHETEPFPGVVPDHRTVALLTNNLADEGYYLIRVHENPAQPGPRSGTVNRLWDLVGRYYEGVYPIEFHLVISGEEIHKGQEVTGETSVLLTVSGSYANGRMEERVVEEWTRLWKRIRLSLHATGSQPRSTTQPLDAPSSELARLRNVMVTEIARLTDAPDANLMDRRLSAEVVSRLTREFGLGAE